MNEMLLETSVIVVLVIESIFICLYSIFIFVAITGHKYSYQ